MKKKAVLVAVIMSIVSLLAGCSKPKYKVITDEADYLEGYKTSYREGEKVTFYYDFIATDTDYSFYLDGVSYNAKWKSDKGYEISFTMPAHDVVFEIRSYNSMEYDPAPVRIDWQHGISASDVSHVPDEDLRRLYDTLQDMELGDEIKVPEDAVIDILTVYLANGRIIEYKFAGEGVFVEDQYYKVIGLEQIWSILQKKQN